jgi:UDP-2-acetamido-2,6-beta-L-arabino-hexul-4-ose reductase
MTMKIAITGSAGLLGWHTAARLHAANCAAKYRGQEPPFQLSLINHPCFDDASSLANAIDGVDAVIHFAGINRGTEQEIATGNQAIANKLAAVCRALEHAPHIIYANSIHSNTSSPYGTSKREAGEILAGATDRYSDLVLPHIFGECARPNYNNVTATLIDSVISGRSVELNPNGQVELLHAGDAADIAISAALGARYGRIEPQGRPMGVVELFDRLTALHDSYQRDIFPDLSDCFDLALFNSYRTAAFPKAYPKAMKPNRDNRGTLFETSKAITGSQTFISTTIPGQLRGDHFHINLVERFLVVKGKATIRIRKVLSDEIFSFSVDGANPVAIDMPPLHTHHIENTSNDEVVTFFWSHRLFDPNNPDTYADPVFVSGAQQ